MRPEHSRVLHGHKYRNMVYCSNKSYGTRAGTLDLNFGSIVANPYLMAVIIAAGIDGMYQRTNPKTP